MVKKLSKVTAHYWIARPLIHQCIQNLDVLGDFLDEDWSFLPFMSHNACALRRFLAIAKNVVKALVMMCFLIHR
jgi:hypothetical protein